ncbi:lysophospholipase [Hahella sp. CR1]|uniref:serine aminopeptidase domain-containing protein n=1 Tax=Hahella sp. CR1 TaxID=2992807 RepID=UPI0024424192|nr:alpha/beta hydrolase [Hahella sp. CR1]MDG9668867.1 lysophospholipase [Hahella sp. CR1]
MKSQPKLVMLPGMDGTGDLFAPFLECIPQIETQIIPLPQTGAQDYDSLAAYVREQLPDDDFYLLAESFSGPIGALLAADGVPGLQGVIFVATFLSIPSPWAVCVGRRLPLQGMMRLPFSSWTQRRLLLGPDVGDDFLQHFTAAVRSIPTATLKARLETLQHLHWRREPVSSPSIYLQATDDYLVSPGKALEIQQHFPDNRLVRIQGPHFLLQANPAACARTLLDTLSIWESRQRAARS